ncbi:MAG: hypothetical protein NW204_04230 [Xanthomonadaceae bacterium]|nr:hypothetical protein [Xanthomonadaceae bacterium]
MRVSVRRIAMLALVFAAVVAAALLLQREQDRHQAQIRRERPGQWVDVTTLREWLRYADISPLADTCHAGSPTTLMFLHEICGGMLQVRITLADAGNSPAPRAELRATGFARFRIGNRLTAASDIALNAEQARLLTGLTLGEFTRPHAPGSNCGMPCFVSSVEACTDGHHAIHLAMGHSQSEQMAWTRALEILSVHPDGAADGPACF